MEGCYLKMDHPANRNRNFQVQRVFLKLDERLGFHYQGLEFEFQYYRKKLNEEIALPVDSKGHWHF